jgi:hypothetical protein
MASPTREIAMSADVAKLIAAGGKEWKSADGKLHRIYFQVASLIGFECDKYKTGNISSATLAGQEISNSLASDYAALCADSKAWVDVSTGEINTKLGYSRRANITSDDLKSALQNRINTIA